MFLRHPLNLLISRWTRREPFIFRELDKVQHPICFRKPLPRLKLDGTRCLHSEGVSFCCIDFLQNHDPKLLLLFMTCFNPITDYWEYNRTLLNAFHAKKQGSGAVEADYWEYNRTLIPRVQYYSSFFWKIEWCPLVFKLYLQYFLSLSL